MTSSGLRQSATLHSRAIIYQRGPPQELILDVRSLTLAFLTHIQYYAHFLPLAGMFQVSQK